MTNVLGELQSPNGLAGRLLNDPALAASFSQLAQNLAVTSSNLNRLGLWRILWKRKDARTNEPPAQILRAPHDPFH